MPFYKVSEKTGRIRIYFEDFPSVAVRSFLKANRWRWDPNEKCWWNFDNDVSRRVAKDLCPYSKEPVSCQSQERVQIFRKGTCGPSAIWMLSCLGRLMIAGKGEITGYDFDRYESSPLYSIREQVRSIKILDGITVIGKRAFFDFSNLVKVELPDSIISIQNHAFNKCSKLSELRMSEKLECLGIRTFMDCTALKEIRLPFTVKEIGEDCFKNWTDEQKIYQLQIDEKTGKPTYMEYVAFSGNGNASAEICFEDFVMVSTNNYCVQSGHIYENIQAQVNILRRDGSIKSVIVPAGYCKTCKKYTMGAWQVEKLRRLGIILCRVVKTQTVNEGTEYDFYGGLSAESILKQYGYSVNSTDELTDEQRKQLLACLMESGICTKQKITSHLSWLIQSREGREELKNAIDKWKMDREFADGYRIGEGRLVAMRALKIRK